tara:strand:- start:702 stop:995 length:294 start_codon:yes stop_codon:yes gene_type:complete
MSEKNTRLANTYMKMRNSYRYGWLKYEYFRNVIRYITGIYNGPRIRAIFQRMLDEEYIEAQEMYIGGGKRAIRYRHNPYHIDGYYFYENKKETTPKT